MTIVSVGPNKATVKEESQAIIGRKGGKQLYLAMQVRSPGWQRRVFWVSHTAQFVRETSPKRMKVEDAKSREPGHLVLRHFFRKVWTIFNAQRINNIFIKIL